MKIPTDKVIELLQEMVPHIEGLGKEADGVIGGQPETISRVGVCLEVTPGVLKCAEELGIDYLVVHHARNYDPGEAFLGEPDMPPAYSLHLSLDAAPGGLNDALAKEIGLKETRDVPLVYRGVKIEKGAVAAFDRRSLGEYVDRIMQAQEGEVDALKLEVYGNPRQTLEKVVVGTGQVVREDFLQRMHSRFAPDLIIGGDAQRGHVNYAVRQGMAIILMGDQASHRPGLRQFAQTLSEEAVRANLYPADAEPLAVFLPSKT